MWRQYNPNPSASRVGDCSVRAVACATGLTWEETYLKLCVYGLMRADMPSANSVWGTYLKDCGFSRHVVPDTCPDCYTVADFAADHTDGVYVVGLNGHVVAIKGGDWFDSWDSGGEIPIYYWKKKGA